MRLKLSMAPMRHGIKHTALGFKIKKNDYFYFKFLFVVCFVLSIPLVSHLIRHTALGLGLFKLKKT